MKSKQILIVFLSVIVIGTVVAFISAQKQTEHINTLSDETNEVENPTDAIGENVSFTVTEAEHKKWEVRVKRALYTEDKRKALLKEIEGEFYNTDGKQVATFSAPEGDYVTQENAVVLTGGVTVRSTEEGGAILKAPKMTWNAKSQQVLAEDGVQLIKEGYGSTTSNQCRFSLDLTSISLEGNTLSRIQM